MTHRGPFQPLPFCDSVSTTKYFCRQQQQHREDWFKSRLQITFGKGFESKEEG